MSRNLRTHLLKAAPACVVAVSIGAFLSESASADPAAERAALIQLEHELENLEPLIKQAESESVSTRRVRFQYAWLRADLEKIKAGIHEYLEVAPTTPRSLRPLAGDYIR